MQKTLGIFLLLVAVCVVTGIFEPNFFRPFNVTNLLHRASLFSVISIGALFVIITGGIDLSIGSVIGFTGVLLPWLLNQGQRDGGEDLVSVGFYLLASVALALFQFAMSFRAFPESRVRGLLVLLLPPLAVRFAVRNGMRAGAAGTGIFIVLAIFLAIACRYGGFGNGNEANGFGIALVCLLVLLTSLGIGVFHGLLITKVRLQPFVVTLCSLMIFRSLARIVANETSQGFGNDYSELKAWFVGKLTTEGPTQIAPGFAPPMPLLIVAVIAAISWVFLNKTIYGRYLLALGRNEQAARFSGIQTDRMVMLAYIICSLLAGIGGILFALDINSVQPSNHGNFYELYAIAAAVLGGCSLRGGEGSVIGVLIGAALLRVLLNSINLLGIPSTWEWFVVGTVILVGVIVDEIFKRIAAARRAAREARGATAIKCGKCGYDMRGAVSTDGLTTCPECGATVVVDVPA